MSSTTSWQKYQMKAMKKYQKEAMKKDITKETFEKYCVCKI